MQPPMLTLGEAAREVGMAKSAISRAIKTGRISATRQEDGSYAIDPAELFRVYPKNRTRPVLAERYATPKNTDAEPKEVAVLRELLAEVRGERDQLRTDRDHWREQAERMTLLLTHQPPASPTEAPQTPPARSSCWRRLTGKG